MQTISLKVQRWIPIHWVELTNPLVDDSVVNHIIKNFDAAAFGAIPGIFTPNRRFRITDGNHRVTAFRRMGRTHVPIIVLSDREYTHIAYSRNELDFLVKPTDYKFTSFPYELCTKLQRV